MAFELVKTIKTDYGVVVEKYVAKNTGIRVFLADVDGPTVSGNFTVATEAHDDDGLPHTLEHLIFLGSEDYPYRGILDELANRCLASGTNAYTAVDHTAYTLFTASDEGFRNLLPIYLDHILYPLLTESGFITEVHHVNENGEDAGVVYCEMQSIENSGSNRCYLAFLRNLYPGHCGYKSETGGLMKNLRESTTNEKIRNYHSNYYRSENFIISITGKIDKKAMLATLDKYNEKIFTKNKAANKPAMKKPWSSAVDDLPATVKETVKYSADDCNNGMVMIGWRGPSTVKSFNEIVYLQVLTQYLNDTSISPMQREFVECVDPYCSCIRFVVEEYSISSIEILFSNVLFDKLHSIEKKLFDLFTDIAEGKQPFDLERMKSVIHRMKLLKLTASETSAHNLLVGAMVSNFLYENPDNQENDLEMRFNVITLLDQLINKDGPFWLNLFKKWFLNRNYVCIIGEPDANLAKQISEEEQLRYKQRREQLGEQGLNKLKKKLTEAQAVNSKPVPVEAINKMPEAKADNLNFHSIKRYTNTENDISKFDKRLNGFEKLPMRFNIDDIKTNFINIRVLLNVDNLTLQQRYYLPLLAEILLETAIERDGKLIPYEEVVKELANDTIKSFVQLGIKSDHTFCGPFGQLLTLVLKVETSKYVKCVKWIKELVCQTVFNEKRLKIVATKMLNDIKEIKRDGFSAAMSVIKSINCKKETNYWAGGIYQQQKFLTDLIKRLDETPDEVLKTFKSIHKSVSSIDNLTVHLSLNVQSMLNVNEQFLLEWHKQFSQYRLNDKIEFKKIKIHHSDCVDRVVQGKPTSVIVGLASIESNCMVQTYGSIDSFLHPDYPALMVLIQYLSVTEGPLWKDVRIPGYTYHYFLRLDVIAGLMSFGLAMSTHLAEAFKVSKKLIESLLSAEYKWEESLLIAARSSLMFELVDKEKTVDLLSAQSMYYYLIDIDFEWRKTLLKKISKITINDLKSITKKYFENFLQHEKTHNVICCQTAKIDEVSNAFESFGKRMTVINVEKDNFMTELN